MTIYTINRGYEVPAENRIEATERMLEAIMLHVEKDYQAGGVYRTRSAAKFYHSSMG